MAVFNERITEKDEKYYNSLIQQWEKCVDMANATSDKRINSNNAFITLNAALLTALQFTKGWQDVLISAVGIAVCVLWGKIIISYRELNKAKYDIIHAIERELPAMPLSDEWIRITKRKKYSGFSNIERFLPRLFIFLFLIMSAYSVYSSFKA